LGGLFLFFLLESFGITKQTMEDYKKEIDDLLEKADNMKNGIQRSEIYFQVFEIAKSNENHWIAMIARIYEMQSYVMSSNFEKIMPIFAWMFNEFKSDPVFYEELHQEILWCAKWTAQNVSSMIDISVEDIEKYLETYKQLILGFDYNLSSYFTTQSDTYESLGKIDEAIEALEKAFKIERDELDDCEACVIQKYTALLLLNGEFDLFFEKSQELREANIRCHGDSLQANSYTWANTALYYLFKKDDELAYEFAMKAYDQQIKDNDEPDIMIIGKMIYVMAKIDKLEEAFDVFDKYIEQARTESNKFNYMYFAKGSMYLFRKMQQNDSKKLAKKFEDEIGHLVEEIDRRNKNDYQARMSKYLVYGLPL